MESLTDKIQSGAFLSAEDIRAAAEMLLDESLSIESKAEFLTSFSQRGETAEEIALFAEEFLTRSVDPKISKSSTDRPLIDVCGTGGDKLDLFNVSTTSVFILAAGGLAVVKHGNRGITSKSGGADVLESLGIRIDLPPEDISRCLDEVGAAFLFAQMYHPTFKSVAPVRKLLAERGQRTMFNLLGPLLNPARPEYQLIGVFDPAAGPKFAEILKKLGRKRAWTVHGTTETGAGMDEISNLGLTHVWSTDPDDTVESTLQPENLDIGPASLSDLVGGDAEENAEILVSILSGSEQGPKRDLVALNAAAGFAIAGIVENINAGLSLARETIDSGKALAVLRKWQEFS
ncbi:MAG: anthranilate phosphoribosyltransferase [Verrucomicrobiales bacterium]|nr:anthranilate phosphoribosyltransferase [Verrucomicrobiales bacterium]